MNPSANTLFQTLLKAARPWSLLAGVLLYALGGGVATYLGRSIDWPTYWIGQAIITMLQIGCYFLREYFDRVNQPPFESEIRIPRARQDAPKPPAGQGLPEPDDGRADEEIPPVRAPRAAFVQVAATAFTIGTALTVLLLAQGALNPASFVILALAFVLVLLYSIPPFRLVYSGYGELALAVLVANLFPAFAYLLQTGELHRLLAMLTFPLTFLYLASALARSLQHYMEDLRLERNTMLTRLGWQRGMSIHNILVLAAYLLLAGSVIAGLPRSLALPAFLSMPVGLFQIWQINSIANGAKPRWRVLALTAMATLALMAYFINLALWTS